MNKFNYTQITCQICNYPKIPANERIIQTHVCFRCAHKIVPHHIPKSQYLKYLLMKGYKCKPSNAVTTFQM